MKKIYVGNLPFDATEEELKDIFKQYGDIQETAMIKDHYSDKFKGFAFITFASPEAAQRALEMDGHDFSGRPMKVNLARENEKRFAGNNNNSRGNPRKNNRKFDRERRGGRW